VRIQVGREAWRMEFEFLDRGWVNDMRYLLIGPQGEAGRAEILFQKGRIARGQLRVLTPESADLVPQWRLFRKCYALLRDGREIGVVQEPSALSMVRTLQSDLPGNWPVPLQIFVLVLVLHSILPRG
jgi:hypothetical protein